jgi:hypothetical protein
MNWVLIVAVVFFISLGVVAFFQSKKEKNDRFWFR